MIEKAEAERDLATDRRPRLVRLLRPLPTVGSLAVGALALRGAFSLLRAREIGPLADLLDGISRTGRLTCLLGILALIGGLVSLAVLRRGRLFRVWSLHAFGLLGTLAGAFSVVVGGYFWLQSNSDWQYVEVPHLDEVIAETFPAGDIARATAVILSPDADGDARFLRVGTGTVIWTEKNRVWIVTCSHVAMPYAAVASWRDAAAAAPVWVYMADGYNARGKVVWTAQPPLDVALVTAEVEAPPRPVKIGESADSVAMGSGVLFVANPLRAGWLAHQGRVTERVSRTTPAGRHGLLFTTLPVQPGDSGSGLFLSDGTLIGINTWRQDGPGGPMALSLPSDAMRGLLDLIERDQIGRLDGWLKETAPR